MGLHLGLVAMKGTVAELRDAVTTVWPYYETVQSASDFADEEALQDWASRHQKFVSVNDWSPSNRGQHVVVFYEDGEWAVVSDPSYVIPGDDAGLLRLSEICGRTLAFVVETAGGCAFFSCVENGRLLRKIEGLDRAVTLTGNSLPEEEGVDVSGYYIDETEALATAFGLTGVACAPLVQTAVAVAFVDQTNYDSREKNTPPLAAKVATKPWWKFW